MIWIINFVWISFFVGCIHFRRQLLIMWIYFLRLFLLFSTFFWHLYTRRQHIIRLMRSVKTWRVAVAGFVVFGGRKIPRNNILIHIIHLLIFYFEFGVGVFYKHNVRLISIHLLYLLFLRFGTSNFILSSIISPFGEIWLLCKFEWFRSLHILFLMQSVLLHSLFHCVAVVIFQFV